MVLIDLPDLCNKLIAKWNFMTVSVSLSSCQWGKVCCDLM